MDDTLKNIKPLLDYWISLSILSVVVLSAIKKVPAWLPYFIHRERVDDLERRLASAVAIHERQADAIERQADEIAALRRELFEVRHRAVSS